MRNARKIEETIDKPEVRCNSITLNRLGRGQGKTPPASRKRGKGWQFRNFPGKCGRPPTESLETKAALEAFLDQQRQEGNLLVSGVKVHDLRASREERFKEEMVENPIQAGPAGLLKYYVLGWIYTRISRWDTQRQNKNRAKRRQQNLSADAEDGAAAGYKIRKVKE